MFLGLLLSLANPFLGLFFVLFALIVIRKGFYYRKVANNEIKSYREDNLVETPTGEKVYWKPTTNVNGFFEIDDINETFAIFEKDLFSNNFTLTNIINYNDLLSYELQKNDKTVISNSYGVTSSFWNKEIYGKETGDIVGSNLATKEVSHCATNIKIRINLKEISQEPIYIYLSRKFSAADEILSALERITNKIDKRNESHLSNVSIDSADEIRKFKALLDDGVISIEEFETKKRQLLDI